MCLVRWTSEISSRKVALQVEQKGTYNCCKVYVHCICMTLVTLSHSVTNEVELQNMYHVIPLTLLLKRSLCLDLVILCSCMYTSLTSSEMDGNSSTQQLKA